MDNKQSKLADLLKQLNDSNAEQLTIDNVPNLVENDEIIDLGNDYDLDDYQVVRREFFAHINEPSVTFNDYKFYVNAACLSKFPKADYAQVLVNQQKKILAIRPCIENEKDS